MVSLSSQETGFVDQHKFRNLRFTQKRKKLTNKCELVRFNLINQIKSEIELGIYENDHKLEIAVDHLTINLY